MLEQTLAYFARCKKVRNRYKIRLNLLTYCNIILTHKESWSWREQQVSQLSITAVNQYLYGRHQSYYYYLHQSLHLSSGAIM